MSWFTNAQYKPEASVCEVPDGTYDIMIADIRIESYNGKQLLAIYLNVNCPAWNHIPYRHTIFEGDNFDYGFSRLCDCFGTEFSQCLNGNWQPFVNKVGKASFSHTKTKKVVTGYDQSGKPIEEWKTEKSDFVNAKLLKKQTPIAAPAPQPAQPQPAQTQQQFETMTKADEAAMAQAFGNPNAPGTPTY